MELGGMNKISGREPHQSESEEFFPCLPFGALTQPLGFPCLLVPRREIRSVTVRGPCNPSFQSQVPTPPCLNPQASSPLQLRTEPGAGT